MYCGNNKIALASQRQIADAMIRLLQDTKFMDISVSSLCREAGVSRQTFYSLFASKENVIIALLRGYRYLPEEGAEACCRRPPICSLTAFCTQFAHYLKDNTDLIRALAENNILYLIYDSFYGSITECCSFLSQMSQADRQYTEAFIAMGFTGIARTYIERGATDSADYLEEEILRLFRGQYL
jgi:AcrR family transcriptional regulator